MLCARRYIYEPSANTLALAERYNISHDFDCKTAWSTKVCAPGAPPGSISDSGAASHHM